jgi:uncharacterized protein YcbX
MMTTSSGRASAFPPCPRAARRRVGNDRDVGSPGAAVGHVTELWRYPVKSFAGERIDGADLDAGGIPDDRRFALRSLESGKILSAKLPRLGTRLLELAARLDPTTGTVMITAGDRTVTTADRAEVDAVLTQHLGHPVRLESTVADDDAYESYWPEIDGVALSDVTVDFPVALATAKTSFVDLAALQMVTTASLAELAARSPGSAIRIERFRPSLVIDTGPNDAGFVENDWAGRTARLGDATITFSVASPRCVMTTLAQHDIPRDLAILRTLATHNRIAMEGLGSYACLGIYAEVTEPGAVAVGDSLALV